MCYCSEPLSFAEADIDHVVPETLAGTANLAAVLERLALPAAFDLFSIRNLVPAHRRCNLAKTSDVFSEANARFFLHIAERASGQVEALVSAKKPRQSKEKLLSSVGKAIRSGLILAGDLQQQQPPTRLRLSKPLVFADAPDVSVTSISPEEVKGYLDRPVLMGGNPVFAADFGDDNGIRLTVRTCKEYRAALAAGFYARTTYDIKSEAFLKVTDAVLSAAETVRLPLVSYIRDPHKGVPDLELLPCSVLPSVSPDDREIIATMNDLSVADILARGEVNILRVSSSELSLVWHYFGVMLGEVCRADFDGDGIEDILCQCYCWATEGSLGYGWTSILSRLGPEDKFVLSAF